MISKNILYLSKRNLLTLLSKLERLSLGENTQCSIIKFANDKDPYSLFIGHEKSIAVVGIPDEDYYINREPGEVHPKDTPSNEESLTFRLRKRAQIRRQIHTRKSVQENKPDRIADLLEEAANELERLNK